ncbi:MAG: ABC transporter substrate-binding protein [Deltaproteobacteria bacterium]|jgi:ABC-type branched-subunit amino acid transport system substrate-binding protein|nr:ABC transporter substrate-binding protein [Deltaproteobacteria bacterium]
MLSRFLVMFFAWINLGLLAGCLAVVNAPGPGSVTGPTGPEAILAQAERSFAQADYAQASRLYEQYLAQGAPGPRLEAILGRAGLAAERSGRLSEAIGHYQNLRTRFAGSADALEVATRLPGLYLAIERPDQALELATSLLATEKEPRPRTELLLAQGRAGWARRSYPEALDSFLAARKLANAGQKTQAEEGVLGALANFNQSALAEVVRAHGQDYPGPEAAGLLAFQSAKMGDMATFAAQTQYFQRYFPHHPWRARLEALVNNPSAIRDLIIPGSDYSYKPDLSLAPVFAGAGAVGSGSFSAQATIAAVLPLTGDASSRFAQEILAGLKLALANSGGRVSLLELDTHGEPGLAAKLVSEAAANPKVLAMVGPLTSREALAAAQMAQRVGLPMLAISTRLGLTEKRGWVFRVFLTVKHQAEAVARYAVKTGGHKRLGALYPNDPYGQAMFGFFQAEVAKLGAQVTARDRYAPKGDDWLAAVARLTGGQSVRRAQADYQAKIDFTALFLPDSALSVSQILAQMAYHDVTKMTCLGTSMWLTPDLPIAAGRYLTGAVIPEAFSSLSQRPESLRFREEFKNAHGREPDQFAAYGHDAGLAVLTALAAGAKDRASIIRQWPTLTVPGATGAFTFGPEGDFLIEPTLLTIEKSAFKLLREAGR